MVANTEAAILGRLIEPESADLPPGVAHFLLRLDFREADRERMDALAAKARDEVPTADELVELENYRQVAHLLALMQSKARRSLKHDPGPA